MDPSCFQKKASAVYALVLLIGVTTFINYADCAAAETNFEHQLLRDIIYSRRMDRYSRPVSKHTDTISVKMELWIYNILGLDEKTEVFSINAVQKLNWKDFNLTWSPQNYSDIKHVNLPDFLVWRPDIVLVNSVNLKESLTNRGWNYIRINYEGRVEYRAPAVYNSHCAMDFKRFPFDEHECQMIFTSWNFFSIHLNITVADSDLKGQGRKLVHLHQVSNTNWEIVNWKASVFYDRFGKEPQNQMAMVQYTFRVRRLADYYTYVILIPVFVIILTSLAVFWFPPFATEKITLGSFMTLCLTLLLVHLYWVVPRSGRTVPGIVVLCGVSMAFVSLSLVISVITISISRGHHTMSIPHNIRSLLLGFVGQKILCLGNSIVELNQEDTTGCLETSDTKKDWMLFAVAIDRLCFLFYVISFIILILAAFC